MMNDVTMNDVTVKATSGKLLRSARDLTVFQRAYRVALDIHRASLEFPKIEQYALADQLRRATKSICANIAEGFPKQKYSSAEFGRFLGMAEASAEEVRVWLQFSHDLGYITSVQYHQWDDDYAAIVAMLVNLRIRIC